MEYSAGFLSSIAVQQLIRPGLIWQDGLYHIIRLLLHYSYNTARLVGTDL